MSAYSWIKPKGFVRFFRTSTRLLKTFRVLGIETSCDDTGAAVVDSEQNILGEVKYSQTAIHSIHGGILPNLAETLHRDNIKEAVDKALKKSNLTVNQLDAISVTVEPGLANSLGVGLEYAKDLSVLHNKPLIPIHHMKAHALTIRLLENVKFPFLVLLVSGGHCILAVAESISKFNVLGQTKDITPGLLFDKLFRRMKLRNIEGNTLLSGGVAIEKMAEKGNPLSLSFLGGKRPPRDCNFQFSGLKTSVKNYIAAQEAKLGIEPNEVLPNIHDICASLQFEITKFICERVEIGMQYLETKHFFDGNEKVLVLSGGVASNQFLRKMLSHTCEAYDCKFLAPPENLCTDNGVMIAWNGIEWLKENLPVVPPENLKSVTISPRSSLGEVVDGIKGNVWKGKYVNLANFIIKSTDKEDIIQQPSV